MTDKYLTVVPTHLPTVEILPPETLPAIVHAPKRRRRSASRRVEGSIFERTKWANGTTSYRLTWYLGEEQDPANPGKTRRRYGHKTVRVKTLDEAKTALAKIIATIKEKTYVAPTNVTVGEACEAWLQSRLDLKKVRANTFDDYASKLRVYVIPRIGSIAIQKLETSTIQSLYNDLLREGASKRKVDGDVAAGLSARTVIHIHRRLRQVLDYARRQRWVTQDPTADVELPAIEDDRRDDSEDHSAVVNALDEKQLDALLTGFRGHQLEALVRLAAHTGMRRGELLALRWCDIDLIKRTLRVEWDLVDGGKTAARRLSFERPKTRRSRRTIALSQIAVADLDALWKQRAEDALKLGTTVQRNSEDLVFPASILAPRRPWVPRNVTKQFVHKATALGFPIRLHDLRHTHATLLLKNGADLKTVSQRLGHANPSITLNIYQHVLPGMQEQVAALFDRVLNGVS